ncbi:hypothetical protein ACWCP6_13750 [Streptomyces sp. NPDC002004]
MIKPESIPLFTGDLGQLDQHVSALRTEADGIRRAGDAAHRQFQTLSAFYTAPEAEDLFASTTPARDAADVFADKVDTVAEALSTYAAEVAPIAKRLEHLQSRATAFVAGLKTSSGDFDENWKHDADKVEEHQALMHDVAAAQAAFTAAEIACHNKITALVDGTQYVMHTGDKQLIPRGAEFYGYSAEALDQAKELPWGTPVSKSHNWWDPDDFNYNFKSFVWDGLIVDNIWGTVDGVFSLTGLNGLEKLKESWTGIGRVLVGSETYLMESGGQKPTGILASDFAQGSKSYAKEFTKSFVAWDQWRENPARASATVVFNLLTLSAGPLKVASAGRAGTAAKAASTVAKVGDAIDPVNAAFKVTGHALPKIAEVTARLRGVDSIPDLHAPHSVLELSDGSKLVVEDGKFVAYNRHGDVITDAPKQGRVHNAGGTARQHSNEAAYEAAANDRTKLDTPAQADHSRDLVGAGARAEHATGATRTGQQAPGYMGKGASGHVASREGSSRGSGSEGSFQRPAADRGTDGHDSSGTGRGEGAHGSGPERDSAVNDAVHPHEGHDSPAEEGERSSETHQTGSPDHELDVTRRALPPGTADRTLREMQAMRHSRNRYKGAESYVRKIAGGAPERHYRVPTHDHPYYPVQGPGGRNVDVPVDMPDGRTLAVEVKHYLGWRTIKFKDGSTRAVKGEVPLSEGIVEQINKDLTLRRLDPNYDPRWVFLHAPPSAPLRNYLIQARIIFIEYGPPPK